LHTVKGKNGTAFAISAAKELVDAAQRELDLAPGKQRAAKEAKKQRSNAHKKAKKLAKASEQASAQSVCAQYGLQYRSKKSKSLYPIQCFV
jgi:23S rRNA G2445 N2-methylase RlmL